MRKIIIIFIGVLVSLPALSQTDVKLPDTVFIGTYQSEPFSFKNQKNEWSGPVHDMWQEITGTSLFEVVYIEYDHKNLRELMDDVEQGKIDVALGPITIAPHREQVIDYTTPFYTTELGIAHKPTRTNLLGDIKRFFLGANFYIWLLLLFGLLLVMGTLIYLVEAKPNPEFDEHHPIDGIFQGAYFMWVTMTTVGYGDKSAKTPLGRLIVGVWMLLSLIFTGIFVANMTSDFTVNKIDFELKTIRDLNHYRVGTVINTNAENYLYHNNVDMDFRTENIKELVEGMNKDMIDVAVYDAPILKHCCDKWGDSNYEVYTNNYQPQYYSIAVNKDDEDLKEYLNREIIEHQWEGDWSQIKTKYSLH